MCLLALMMVEPARAAGPLIVTQSSSMEAREGAAFAASVVALGEALEYQWFRNEEAIDGQTGDTLVLGKISQQNAGSYHVVVSNAEGATSSEAVTLAVTPAPELGVAPGEQKLVSVPGHLAYYDLYLPTAYGNSRNFPPVLITFDPSGGGMVGHFRTVAEEKGWIVVGVAQGRNLQGFQLAMLYSRAVIQHVMENLRIDPNRIFVAGMSGGGWVSFENAKINAPLVAGVFSMGGWLGRQYSTQRDIYLSDLLVARANGDVDTNANYFLSADLGYLLQWTDGENIRDWSFPGGHVPAPAEVQREVFDWLIANTTPSTSAERDVARAQEALWKADITAGEIRTVFDEVVATAFGQPRTPLALAAWRTMDFLFSRDEIFLREAPQDFADYPLRNFLAVHLHHALYAFIQHRDPSRMFSAVAAVRALGANFEAVQMSPVDETNTILRHPPRTSFDAFILENALSDRPEPPLMGDWDGDGRNNFSEHVLGASPLLADSTPAAEIRIIGHDAHAIMPGCRDDRVLRLAVMATSNPAWGWWLETPVLDAWWRPSSDGSRTVTKRVADLRTQPQWFVRFTASPDPELWQDANHDGIPLDYQFPQWRLTGEPPNGDSPDLPDARQSTAVAGGPPMHLRYLTAAEIGPVEDRGGSLRYHPALAGYRGYLYHEVWMNVPGSTIASAASVIASRPPNDVRLITSSEAPWFNVDGVSVLGDSYFERSRGYIVPDTSGNHTFSIAGDDQCELWLSTGSNPANAVRIAYHNTWTGYKNFTQNASQTSAPVMLVAGNSYYVEILHKEGNGSDHCNVAWMPPGTSTRVVIPSANLKCLPANLISHPGE
jgi:hypothetical protein